MACTAADACCGCFDGCQVAAAGADERFRGGGCYV
eukprot:gene38507-25592_t